MVVAAELAISTTQLVAVTLSSCPSVLLPYSYYRVRKAEVKGCMDLAVGKSVCAVVSLPSG